MLSWWARLRNALSSVVCEQAQAGLNPLSSGSCVGHVTSLLACLALTWGEERVDGILYEVLHTGGIEGCLHDVGLRGQRGERDGSDTAGAGSQVQVLSVAAAATNDLPSPPLAPPTPRPHLPWCRWGVLCGPCWSSFHLAQAPKPMGASGGRRQKMMPVSAKGGR